MYISNASQPPRPPDPAATYHLHDQAPRIKNRNRMYFNVPSRGMVPNKRQVERQLTDFVTSRIVIPTTSPVTTTRTRTRTSFEILTSTDNPPHPSSTPPTTTVLTYTLGLPTLSTATISTTNVVETQSTLITASISSPTPSETDTKPNTDNGIKPPVITGPTIAGIIGGILVSVAIGWLVYRYCCCRRNSNSVDRTDNLRRGLGRFLGKCLGVIGFGGKQKKRRNRGRNRERRGPIESSSSSGNSDSDNERTGGWGGSRRRKRTRRHHRQRVKRDVELMSNVVASSSTAKASSPTSLSQIAPVPSNHTSRVIDIDTLSGTCGSPDPNYQIPSGPRSVKLMLSNPDPNLNSPLAMAPIYRYTSSPRGGTNVSGMEGAPEGTPVLGGLAPMPRQDGVVGLGIQIPSRRQLASATQSAGGSIYFPPPQHPPPVPALPKQYLPYRSSLTSDLAAYELDQHLAMTTPMPTTAPEQRGELDYTQVGYIHNGVDLDANDHEDDVAMSTVVMGDGHGHGVLGETAGLWSREAQQRVREGRRKQLENYHNNLTQEQRSSLHLEVPEGNHRGNSGGSDITISSINIPSPLFHTYGKPMTPELVGQNPTSTKSEPGIGKEVSGGIEAGYIVSEPPTPSLHPLARARSLSPQGRSRKVSGNVLTPGNVLWEREPASRSTASSNTNNNKDTPSPPEPPARTSFESALTFGVRHFSVPTISRDDSITDHGRMSLDYHHGRYPSSSVYTGGPGGTRITVPDSTFIPTSIKYNIISPSPHPSNATGNASSHSSGGSPLPHGYESLISSGRQQPPPMGTMIPLPHAPSPSPIPSSPPVTGVGGEISSEYGVRTGGEIHTVHHHHHHHMHHHYNHLGEIVPVRIPSPSPLGTYAPRPIDISPPPHLNSQLPHSSPAITASTSPSAIDRHRRSTTHIFLNAGRAGEVSNWVNSTPTAVCDPDTVDSVLGSQTWEGTVFEQDLDGEEGVAGEGEDVDEVGNEMDIVIRTQSTQQPEVPKTPEQRSRRGSKPSITVGSPGRKPFTKKEWEETGTLVEGDSVSVVGAGIKPREPAAAAGLRGVHLV